MTKISTRDLIVETASKLFYDKGYNLIGINEIIAKSGIAKATLYNHFKSKEDLCLAYLDDRDQKLMESLKQHCDKLTKGKKQLIGILEFVLDFYNDKKFNGCWCLRTIAEVPKDNKRIRAKIKASKTQLLDFIESKVINNTKDLNNKDISKLARTIYLLYESSLAESHLHGESWPIESNIDILKSLLKKI